MPAESTQLRRAKLTAAWKLLLREEMFRLAEMDPKFTTLEERARVEYEYQMALLDVEDAGG